MVKAKERSEIAGGITAEEREAMTPEARAIFDAGVEGFRTCQILPVLAALVSQFSNLEPIVLRRDWSFFGPPDHLLKFMLEKRSGAPDGLPLSGEELLTFLQKREIIRKIRQDGKIRVSIEPSPGSRRPGPGVPPLHGEKTQMLIRVERIESAEDRVLAG